jgi:NodT family efflux transporter outer membrane factor (OMF) lipoprotein
MSMRPLFCAAFVAGLTGCASMAGLRTQSQPTDALQLKMARSLEGVKSDASAWPSEDWWRAYSDPQLDALMAEALGGSPSLRLARSRLDRAVAVAEAAGAPLAPQLSGSVDATRQRFSRNALIPPPFAGQWRWQNQALLNFSYEFDFWGKNAAAYASALGQAKAAEVDAYAARLVLASGIARAYVQLARGFDQLELARETVAQREKTLALVTERVNAGLDSRVELKQAEAALPEARERVVQVEEAIALTRNQIAALAGRGPDRGLALVRPKIASSGAPALPTLLPADLIGRRPDVVAGRWRVEAAVKDIDNARAQFYPNVNLIAFAGFQSLGWSKFLEVGSRSIGVGPALRLPIFDGGRLRGNLGTRNADYDAAVEQYNQTLVDALREVADQLAAFRSIAAQEPETRAALAASQESYELVLARYRAGLANYLTVVQAEAQVTAQRSLIADLRARELDAAIGLARALGGGYPGGPGPRLSRTEQ